MAKMPAQRRTMAATLSSASACYAAEVWIARASDDPLRSIDLLLAAAALALTGATCGAISRAIDARAGWAARLLVVAPAGIELLGMTSYSLRGHLVPLAAAPLLWLAALVIDPRRPRTAALLTLAAIGAWAGSGWLSLPGPVPGALWGAALGGLLLLAGIVHLPRGAAGAVLVSTAAALLPGSCYDRMPPWTATAPANEGPDIILVVVDTLRVDAASGTRVYEQLASSGRAWSRVQASGTWTLPSMASIHTGTSVDHHGAGRIPDVEGTEKAPITAAATTLAEALSAAGYDTAAILAMNNNISRQTGFDRGFAVFDLDRQATGRLALPRGSAHRARPLAGLVAGTLATKSRSLALRRLLDQGSRDDAWTTLALARQVIERRRTDRPLLLWVQLMDPHLPYRHVERLDDVRGSLLGAMPELNVHDVRDSPTWQSSEARNALRASYDHEVGIVDEALGDFLAKLGPQPERGRVVVFTSDHGEEFWEHGGFEHGHAVWQEVTGVPLVISGVDPSRLRGAQELAGHADIAPTLLALAGVAPPASMTGRSLLGGGQDHYLTQNLLYGDPRGAAVRRGDDKLIQVDGQLSLYDLSADPTETTPIANSARSEVLEALLPTGHPSGQGVEFDAEQRESLGALGYIDE